MTQFAGSATPLLFLCWYFPPFPFFSIPFVLFLLTLSLSLFSNKCQPYWFFYLVLVTFLYLTVGFFFPFQQVAATADQNEIVGMIRGCIKTVTCGQKLSRSAIPNSDHQPPKHLPVYTKLAYILGLRVSPAHRYVFVFLFVCLFVFLCYIKYNTLYSWWVGVFLCFQKDGNWD